MNPELTLIKAHEIVSEIERKILAYKKNAEIMIRQDPTGIKEHTKSYHD